MSDSQGNGCTPVQVEFCRYRFDELTKDIGSVGGDVKKMLALLIGNGKPGIDERVRVLEKASNNREKLRNALIGAAITVGTSAAGVIITIIINRLTGG